MCSTSESPPNKKGLVPERFRDQPLVGYAFIAAAPVLHQASARCQRLGSEPAWAISCHDLAEQVDHLGAVGSARLRATGCPDERCFSKALRLVKCREMDKKPSVALIRHESGQDPASDAAKPIPKPTSAAQLCSDDQTHHPAIAHLSPFWPRTQQIARKSRTLRPATRTRRRKQGTEGCSRQCAALPRCQRERAFAPVPLSGSKHPRRTERARTASACGNGTPDNGKRLRQREHATTACARAASYSKYLATPTGMHWRIRPISSASSKSMPWSNQWRVQPAQPFEKKSRQTPFPPHRARRARARGRRRRHAAHGALRDTGCSRPGR